MDYFYFILFPVKPNDSHHSLLLHSKSSCDGRECFVAPLFILGRFIETASGL